MAKFSSLHEKLQAGSLLTGAFVMNNENGHPPARYIVVDENSESRLTVVSREAKKKQHACASSGPRDHYSELFTRMAALKF